MTAPQYKNNDINKNKKITRILTETPPVILSTLLQNTSIGSLTAPSGYFVIVLCHNDSHLGYRTLHPRSMTKYIPGQNNFYVSARADSLVVGGWRPAIWLDQDLDRGKDNILYMI